MRVLIGCEFSGIVREEFKKRGHNAWSCDLLPTEIPGQHIQRDILEVINDDWDLGIFHPPCTHLANSGVQWLDRYNKWDDMKEAAAFFNVLLNAPIEKIAIENPIQHGYARELIRKYDQIIQPSWFGEPYRKATCLWLKNLPKLLKSNEIPKDQCKQQVWLESPSPDRWKNRSRTYQGVAEQFAAQWG